jgi:hypothetical protein
LHNTAYIYGGDVNVARTYAVNGLNQYVAAVSNGVTTSFQHDRNGNLTSDGAVSFVYDAENRLIAASGAANAVGFKIGASWCKVPYSGGLAGLIGYEPYRSAHGPAYTEAACNALNVVEGQMGC